MKVLKYLFLICITAIVLAYSIPNKTNVTRSHNSFDRLNESTENPILIETKYENNKYSHSASFGKINSFRNLDLVIISGKSSFEINYTPLIEAINKGGFIVKETSNVNELKVSNESDEIVFIQAGDIVKGGKQDRALAFDMIIAPNSKNLKIPSFCVESGRWEGRGNEETNKFSGNKNMISSKKLKIASRNNKNQGEVWSSISKQQEMLNYNLSNVYNDDVEVKSKESTSSLELTLSNSKLIELKKEYKKHFDTLLTDSSIGIAFIINGELNSIDIYNNHNLFKKYYEKLVDAAIVESISVLNLDTDSTEFNINQLRELLPKTNTIKEQSKKLNNRTKWNTYEDSLVYVFTSSDIKSNNNWLHKNILFKDN